jgi:hypothetical protein
MLLGSEMEAQEVGKVGGKCTKLLVQIEPWFCSFPALPLYTPLRAPPSLFSFQILSPYIPSLVRARVLTSIRE